MSVADLPQPADLAVIIIPAQHVPEELERCGKAGVRSAVILSSGFAEASGDAGSNLQAEIRAIARRYDMAVSGPNSEGFANIAANLCPTFSPAMEASDRPLVPTGRARRQAAVAAQSGGMGFAFFDHGRAKELSFRYIVTTGNEACLEALDFAEFILDEGETDALLLLLEDVKTAATFRRVAEKALRAGKPIIVNKIGQSDAGVRAAASHTAALAGTYAAYRAMFQRDGSSRAATSPRWWTWPRGFSPGAIGFPAGGGSASARPRAAAGAGWRTPARPPAWRFPCSMMQRGGASMSTCRRTVRRRTRSMPQPRPYPRSATPALPNWCFPLPRSTASSWS